MAFQNVATGKFRFAYIEVDQGTNAWDKVPKYNRLYKSDAWESSWWVKLADRFPVVMVFTTTPTRARAIQEAIERQNVVGLEWRLQLLNEIREEVMGKCLGTNTNGPTG